jgi:arylsulfatase A-like enzyme
MFRLVSAVLFITVASAFELTAASAEKTNIVYIMADELGYYELSCMGNPNIKTPRIDAMAAEGIRFTQALAGSAVCAPTRCCLMTGKHSGHTSVRVNGGGTPLRAEEVTVASILHDVGYATGGFGKWGCGGRGSTGVPEKHGFDTFFGYYDQVHAHTYYPPYLVRNSAEVPLKNNHGASDGETYSQYEIHNAAKKFIRDNRDQPFFCYMPITPPHGIFDIPDADPAWQIYKDKDWPEQAKRYAAMVTMVDREVGEVLDLLRELELEENTIVFFCGDNGGNDYFSSKERPRGFHGANKHPTTGVEFRGRKGQLYEGGLRIPMMARWPGKIAPGQVSDLLWYFPDFMPTVAELCGAKTPADSDGISIVPELLGESAAGRKQEQHQYLYWEIGGQTAVRMGHWKAIQPRGKAWELYDLESDVSETNDLSAEKKEVLATMISFAKQAHTPAVEGTFFDRDIHERDRQAKFGGKRKRSSQANVLPKEGLLPNDDFRLLRFSSQTASHKAVDVIDGNPKTHWHTSFTPKPLAHPHELVIDLGKRYEVRGFRYLARQDNGWNGAIKDCEISVSTSSDKFDGPAIKATFRKTKQPQEVVCEPVRGRFVRIRALSEVNGGPWASISELGIVGQP